MKKKIRSFIKKRQRKYLESRRLVLLADDADRNFFRNVKSFQAGNHPKQFDVRELFPDLKEDADVADQLLQLYKQ